MSEESKPLSEILEESQATPEVPPNEGVSPKIDNIQGQYNYLCGVLGDLTFQKSLIDAQHAELIQKLHKINKAAKKVREKEQHASSKEN